MAGFQITNQPVTVNKTEHQIDYRKKSKTQYYVKTKIYLGESTGRVGTHERWLQKKYG